MNETMVALGISPTGQPIPIQLTPAGLLAVSGGSGYSGPGAFVDGMVLLGISSNGIRTPLAVDANGIIQTSGGSTDLTTVVLRDGTQPMTGRLTGPSATFTANGAASTPALTLTGTIYTAGTTTTTKPQLLIEPTGTPSTNWTAAGTAIGANIPTGYLGMLLDLQTNGASRFNVQYNGQTMAGDGGVLLAGTGIQLPSTGGIRWNTGALLSGTDLGLFRDAANVLAQRNGTSAQQFSVYNTYTDGSNYERASVAWVTNVLQIGTYGAGTGVARSVSLVVGGSVYTTFSTNGLITFSNGNQLFAQYVGSAAAPTYALADATTGMYYDGSHGIGLTTNGALKWQINSSGHLLAASNLNIWNGTSALATNATAGFLGVNSCAGTPTGVPASVPTGQTPLVFDSTNLRLYAYTGGAWKSVLLA